MRIWMAVFFAVWAGLSVRTVQAQEKKDEGQAEFPFDAVEARRRQEAAALALGVPVEKVVDLGNKVNIKFVLIPPGVFPRLRSQAQITKAFYFGVYEVTQAQWEAVMGENPSFFKDREDSPNRPVERVTWTEVTEVFLPAIQKLAPPGMRFRLPTEAEWEHACRAGTDTGYSFGSKITPELANIADSGLKQTVAVGTYQPNAWGLYDMHGNVAEWCEDWYDMDFYSRGPKQDPVNRTPSDSGGKRVMRGGSWLNEAYNNRSTERLRHVPGYRNINTGIRLVLSF